MFEPTWQSLDAHGVPEWLRRARFGIWAHWGPQCVARSGDWYARHLYGMQDGSAEWELKRATRQSAHHRRHFGSPAEVGYKDIIPLWRAERFDAAALVSRFQRAGARYFMSMGVHSDNFALWNSPRHAWNAARVGPRRDIVAEWEAAVRQSGLPFGLSFHNNWTWRWFVVAHGTGPDGRPHDGRLTAVDGQGRWWEGLDPQDLYLAPRRAGSPPPRSEVERFYALAWEATERYRPDLVYFDDLRLPFDEGSEVPSSPPRQDGLDYLARYYNAAAGWDLPFAHGIVSIKRVRQGERGAVLLDSERRQLDSLQEVTWQFDTSDGEWFDNLDDDPMFHPRKSARQVIHTLIDVVSKNGALLLNVPQRADGTLDAHSDELLETLTEWMSVCAEAVHDTVPWRSFGEGPTSLQPRDGYNEGDLPYTHEDIRFTTRDRSLYATALGWPADGALVIRSLTHSDPVDDVTLLGHGPVSWQRTSAGLRVTVPPEPPTPHAGVLRIR